MRSHDHRRPFAALALLPLLLLLGLLAAGCGSDEEPASDDASASESATDDSEEAESEDGEATESESAEGSEDAEGSDDGAAPTGDDAAVCDPYLEMVGELEKIDYTSGDENAIAAEMGPIMKAWAEQVPDLDQPESMSDDAWDGLQTLAGRVSDLPDEPTNDQIEAVESDLSREEKKDVDEAGKWFQTTCAPV